MGQNKLPKWAKFACQTHLKRYGYALHQLTEIATISKEGAVSIKQSGLFHVVAGGRSSFSRIFYFESSPDLSQASIQILNVWRLPLPGETTADIEEVLSELMSGKLPKGCEVVKEEFRATPLLDPENPKAIKFEINAPFDLPNDREEKAALAFSFEIQVTSPPKTVKTTGGEKDFYYKTIQFPCRNYTLLLEANPDAGFTFAKPAIEVTFQGNRHPGEESRLTPKHMAGGKKTGWDIGYPLPGASYRLNWDVWAVMGNPPIVVSVPSRNPPPPPTPV